MLVISIVIGCSILVGIQNARERTHSQTDVFMAWLCSPLLSGADLLRGESCGKSKVSLSKSKGMDGCQVQGHYLFVVGEVALCVAPRPGYQL